MRSLIATWTVVLLSDHPVQGYRVNNKKLMTSPDSVLARTKAPAPNVLHTIGTQLGDGDDLEQAKEGERASANRQTTVDNDGDGLDDAFEMQCAQRFKPVMYLHSDERYGPGKVDDYLRSCKLRRMDSCSSFASLAEGAETDQEGGNASRASCPSSRAIAIRQAGCWWRDKDDTLGDASSELLGQYREYSGGEEKLYLRCLGCHGNKCNDMGMDKEGARGVLTEEGLRETPFHVHVVPDNRFGRPMINIQYWFWYPFNGPTLSFGVHQGDWEHFAILVDDTCTNRLKYRSVSHGGSGWQEEGTGDVEFENGAIVTYAAVNSHAGYMTAGEHKGGTIVSKDYTNKGRRWYPDELVNVGETTCSGGGRRPMSNATAFVDFVGWWGTASAFDGVLETLPLVGSLCPSGPGWQFNKETPFGCRSR